MDLGLQNRVVFVAGSSRGIGKGIAAAFLAEGARVVISGRDAETVAVTAAEFAATYGDLVMAVIGDLREADAVRRSRQEVGARWGAVEILICNVGSGAAKNGWRLDPADWARAFETNLCASVGLVEVFLPSMVEARQGSILFIGSIAGLESLGAPLPYGAAKAALEHYSRSLARHVGGYGVRVNTLAPGNILFPGGTWQRKLDLDQPGVMSMIAAEVPLARFGTPEEIGWLASFLASPRASFVTGACVVADGGQTRA